MKTAHEYQAEINRMLTLWTKPKMELHQSYMRTTVEDLFVSMRRDGDGLTWSQERAVEKAMGIEYFPAVPMKVLDFVYKPKDSCICHRIPSKDWHLENCPQHKDKAGDARRVTFTGVAPDPRVPAIPSPEHSVVDSEEYKAMLAARNK